jgi:hypothetical protein
VLGAGEEICAGRVEQTQKKTTKIATAFIPILEHGKLSVGTKESGTEQSDGYNLNHTPRTNP